MPTSPAPGAILQADAATLRPAANAAIYTYRGYSTPYTGATQVVYSNVVTQSVAGQSTTETASNSGNTGVDTTTFSVANGTVTEVGNFDLLGNGTVVLKNPVELKSPVRQDEQYNLIDVHVANAIDDVDSDGKKDAVDVAAYRRVIGAEDVTLENLGTFHAVRVDTVVLIRVQGSAKGDYSPTNTSTLSVWYVPGVGPVKQRSDTASASTGRNIAEERLVRWDGLTAGLGYSDAVPLRAAANAGLQAGAQLRANFWNQPMALGFSSKAMVVTNNPDLGAGGFAVNLLDLRGAVTSTNIYPGYYFRGQWQLVKVGNGAVLASQLMEATVNYTVLDANGVASAQSFPPASLDLGQANFTASNVKFAGGTDRVWMAWIRYAYDAGLGRSVTELVVRAFDLDGQWMGPEIVVAHGAPLNHTLSASGSNVLLTWKEVDAQSVAHLKTGWLTAGASQATVNTFTELVGGQSKSVNVSGDLGQFTLTWGCAFAADLCDEVHGVVMDAGGQVRRAFPGGNVDQETLTGLWPGAARNNGFVWFSQYAQADSATHSAIAVKKSVKLWAEDSSATDTTELRWMDVTSSPLATAPARSIRFADVQETSDPSAVVWFADRMLLISNSPSYGLYSTVVWRR